MGLNKKCFRIAEKIAAQIMGVATDKDREQLNDWARETSRNTDLWKQLTQRNDFEENQRLLEHFPADEAWENVRRRLDGDRQKYLVFRKWWGYAAAVLLLLGVGTFYWAKDQAVKVDTTILVGVIPSGIKGAKLTLGDGKVVEITPEKEFSIAEADGTLIRKDVTGIDYTQTQEKGDSLVYNQMETSTGMEYMLTLADGTRVYLNAESHLKFPATFRGEQRIVELKGEAYFRVAKDAAHPFIVKMDGVELRVVGTSFNARSYPNESRIVTTLVEGKVEVNGRRIAPGEQALYSRNGGLLTVEQVDSGLFTAWQEGRFVFRNERLEDIMKNLARWYGIEYHFLDERVKDIRIGASFGRYEDMNPIIEMLRRTDLVDVMQTNRSLYFFAKK